MLMDVAALERLRRSHGDLLLLDVRRMQAFDKHPQGIPGAVPLLLDEDVVQIPDLPRTTPVAVYCLCRGQASASRAAFWLRNAGYPEVYVLEGGLPEWERAGMPMAPVALDSRDATPWMDAPALGAEAERPIAEQAWLTGEELPLRRDVAVLFVDMVDSTRMVLEREPEEVLELVQAFMRTVVQVTTNYCGDVHDFEGDGAMLYFAGAEEAMPAAVAVRAALRHERARVPDLPEARFALAEGPMVVGHVGTEDRRALAFIGPCINTAARLLKVAPVDAIIATRDFVASAASAAPDLAAQFCECLEPQELKGFPEPVEVRLNCN